MSRPMVFTGIGVAAPNGLGTPEFWAATLAGRNGIAPIRRFDASRYPAQLAGEVPGFEPAEHLPNRLLPQTDHMTRLALVAADQALADAGIRPGDLPEFDIGVVTASSAGGFEFGQRELENLWRRGGDHVSAYQSFAWFYAVNTGQISIRNGTRGPGEVLVSDEAGGLDALAHARRQLRRGTRVVITGGVDGSLCPWGWVAQLAIGRLSTRDEPGRAYLPFDAEACGYVPGEGGAILVMEDLATARERGAPRIYGEIAGYGATFDPAPERGRQPGLRRAIELALADAGTSPDEIDVVFADAAGVRDLDRIEAAALASLFGPACPVTAPKTMTGRLNSGAGTLDVAAALLSIGDGVIPPTINVTPDPDLGIDLVTRARPAHVRTALVVARGYGGFNSAVLVRAVPERTGRTVTSGDERQG